MVAVSDSCHAFHEASAAMIAATRRSRRRLAYCWSACLRLLVGESSSASVALLKLVPAALLKLLLALLKLSAIEALCGEQVAPY